jgi:sugar phosphate isomerase/epimerase
MQFGLCWSPSATQMQDHKELARALEGLKKTGADYLEMGASALLCEQPAFETLRRQMQEADLSVPAVNSFIPGIYRLTGPEADHSKALDYCRRVLTRAQEIGVEVIVLGSSGARRKPDGFGQESAEAQFCEFCRALAPLADASGIDIAIEPLNAQEDNLILSVEEGARLVDIIDRPRIQLLADLYHISQEKEPLEHVAQAGARLRHAHLADRGRVVPGLAPEEEDFIGFFTALQRSGYAARQNARCSFEGHSDDLLTQGAPLLAFLRRRWEESTQKEGTNPQDSC